MSKSSYIRTYLYYKNNLHPFSIWIKTRGNPNFQILETYETNNTEPPRETPEITELWHMHQDETENKTNVWLKYPEGYFIVISFYASVILEANDLSIIYHLLYPCYSELCIREKDSQLQKIKEVNEIYSTLTKFSIHNMGIEKIIQELRQLIGLPLMFIDLINSEQYPKNKKLPKSLNSDTLRKLFTAQKDPIYWNNENVNSLAYYIYPIISGPVCLGCFVIFINRELTKFELAILEQGETITALELVKNQSLIELYYRKAYQYHDELIHCNDSVSLANICNELSIDISANYISIVFAFTSNIDLQIMESCVHRLVFKIKKELADVYQTVFCFHNKVTVVASLQGPEHIPGMVEKINGIIKHTQLTENMALCAGMGSLYVGAGNLSKSYNEAIKTLAYQISRHNSGLLQYSEIGINQLLINLPQEDAQTFLNGIFNPLRNISKNQNNYLEETLIAYIETNCSAVQTAEKLYIHINTLYQRLKKIEDCLKISFSNLDDLMRIKLACYLKSSYANFSK